MCPKAVSIHWNPVIIVHSEPPLLSAPRDPFFQPADWLSFGLAALANLAVYLRTLAPELTIAYSGELSTAANYGGVAHPPGFPAWTVYVWLFANLLPVSNIAWRVAVGSAVAAALASGLVALMVSRTGQMLLRNHPSFTVRKPLEQICLRAGCGFIAGVALGLSRRVWSSAVIVETWTFTILLFAALLCLLLRWSARPERKRFLYGAFLLFGLLLTGNQELLIVLPAILVFVLLADPLVARDLALIVSMLAVADWAISKWTGLQLPACETLSAAGVLFAFCLAGSGALIVIIKTRRFGSEWKTLLLCATAFLLGFDCYLYLPLASMANPPMNWGYPRTVEGFFHVIGRGQFERPNPTAYLKDYFQQLWLLARIIANSFGWPYLLFVPLPLVMLRRNDQQAQIWLLGLLATMLCTGMLMLEYLDPTSDRPSADLTSPYFAALFVVLALWTGLGLMVAGNIAMLGGRPKFSSIQR